jgi:hypothetical protein
LYAGLFGVKHNFPMAAELIKKTKGKTAKDVRRYVSGSYFMQLVNCSGMCMFGAMTSRLPLVASRVLESIWTGSGKDSFKPWDGTFPSVGLPKKKMQELGIELPDYVTAAQSQQN